MYLYKNASSGESVGDWYVSNSGPYISPCTLRRQWRIAEPPFLFP
jgi:hypothetical protein